MTQVKEQEPRIQASEPSIHPLEPLAKAEVEAVVEVIRRDARTTATTRFVSVVLSEPSKQAVIDYEPGDQIEREAFVVLLDNATGQCVEAVVSLDRQAVTSWRPRTARSPRSCWTSSSSARRP